jgi:hypothetical protein
MFALETREFAIFGPLNERTRSCGTKKPMIAGCDCGQSVRRRIRLRATRCGSQKVLTLPAHKVTVEIALDSILLARDKEAGRGQPEQHGCDA